MNHNESNGRIPVTLRLPKELVARIDELRESLPVTVPRNTWIAEAVVRRVDREKAKRFKGDVAK